MENMAQIRQKLDDPRIELDEKIVAEFSINFNCTQEEICSSNVGVSRKTLQRNYGQIIDDNRNKGKASLRKKMWELALKETLICLYGYLRMN
jgi:hypothetical protein